MPNVNINPKTPLPGPALYSATPLSFWGGIDPRTGVVIDRQHPLCGVSTKHSMLCLPSGRGSCTGSQVMLELILNGVAPRAVILREADVILCVGVIVAEEFFDVRDLPVICVVGDEKFEELLKDNDDFISLRDTANEDVVIETKRGPFAAKNLLRMKDTLESSSMAAFDDSYQDSHAKALALKTIRRVASISSATELIPIKSAHIDAVTYIGRGGLNFVQKLVQLGGKVAVPTTLNSQSVDRRRWKQLGVDPTYARNANSVGDAYLEMGCEEMSFTCAPYLLPGRPQKGDDIMWGESNAVVYSNSILGARTEKYADYFDILAAMVGAVPKVGVHITENRMPTIIIDAEELIREHLPRLLSCRDVDSFFPAMGWLCGNLSDGGIPLILGFDALPSVSDDNLKAFCAAFGTTGTAPLFHMANVTPEAMGDDVVQELLLSCCHKREIVTKDHLIHAYETLDDGTGDSDEIHLVALGNPHLSLTELEQLRDMVTSDGRPKKDGIEVIATLGRHVHSEGRKLHYVQSLERFGVRFINDTCWCMLLDPPIIPHNHNAMILTNSAKYATYGPGLTNRRMRFGSMLDCVEASKTGKMPHRGLPLWLRSFSTLSIRHLLK
eukprot:CCRYP_013618-RA/>CCRYP_013618-RA protein AED:0.15 eAED:0.15 QI:404/1/1/1/1/1/2/2466/610